LIILSFLKSFFRQHQNNKKQKTEPLKADESHLKTMAAGGKEWQEVKEKEEINIFFLFFI
jgi:hypothetical protein